MEPGRDETIATDNSHALRRLLGRRLRALRLTLRYSQEGLARDLGVSGSTLSNWERGHVALSVDELERICRYFGVQAGELFVADTAAGSQRAGR